MAGNVYSWETTAANNDDADADVNWAEGQLPGTINSSARSMMSAVAGWLKDTNGTITTGGAANAYTATSNTAYAALATGLEISVKANHTNTGASTLVLNALASKAIRKFTVGGDVALAGNEMMIDGHYTLRYDTAANSAAGAWMLLNPTISNIAFPAAQNASADSNTLDDYEEGTTTPTVTASSGTFTSVSCTLNYTKIGNRVLFDAIILITTPGTAAGQVQLPLPFTAGTASAVTGGEIAIVGFLFGGFINASTAAANLIKYDGTTVIGTGHVLQLSGNYRV